MNDPDSGHSGHNTSAHALHPDPSPSYEALGRVNKSTAVRAYLRLEPDATDAEVVEGLLGRNIAVTQALVATVREKMDEEDHPRKE